MKPIHETDEAGRAPQAAGQREAALVVVGQVVLLLGGVAAQSLLAYTLLPDGRGAYAVCLLFGTFLGLASTLGAERGSQYFVMTRGISVSQGVSASLTICSVGSVLAIALAAPLISSGIPFFQKADAGSFYLALTLVPILSFGSALTVLMAGLRRFGPLALWTAAQSAASLLSLAVLVLGLGLGVDGAIASFAVGHAVLILGCLWDLRREFALTLELPRRSSLRPIIGYGTRAHLAEIGHVADLQVGVLLLGLLAVRADIGIFAVASGLMVKLFIFGIALSAVLLPRVAGDPEGRPELVAQCFRVSAFVTGCALIGVLALGAPMVRVVFSEAFLPVVPLLWIMAPGVLVNGASGIFVTYLRGTNRPGACSWAIWMGLTANVVVLVALYPVLGVTAAAWAMTASFVVRGAFIVIAYRKISGKPWLATLAPRRSDVRLLLSSGRVIFRRTAA